MNRRGVHMCLRALVAAVGDVAALDWFSTAGQLGQGQRGLVVRSSGSPLSAFNIWPLLPAWWAS